MIGTTVSFWEYDRKGEMTKFEGVVEDRFVDPDERFPRTSLAVRMWDGSVQTPYEDECRETSPAEFGPEYEAWLDEQADRHEMEVV